MRTTYAVSWQEAGLPLRSGRLELAPTGLLLEGANGDGPVSLLVPYSELAGFHLGRSAGDRLDGRPTLILELNGGSTVKIVSVAQPGILAELAERLSASLTPEAPQRAVLVVPLRAGGRESVAKLLAKGPPFDPGEVGLDRHEVFLTAQEAVFVFEGASASFLERIAADESVWDAAEAWRPHVAGRIRYADSTYVWAR